jgi:hypothetical protein
MILNFDGDSLGLLRPLEHIGSQRSHKSGQPRKCNRLPPKRVQQGVVDRFGIETLAGGGQATTALHASQLQPKVCILLQYA